MTVDDDTKQEIAESSESEGPDFDDEADENSSRKKVCEMCN